MEKTAFYMGVKLTSPDKIFAFTNYYQDITIDSTTYSCTETINIENIELNSALNNTFTTFTIALSQNQNNILQYKKQLIAELFCIKITKNQYQLIKLKRGKVSEITIEENQLAIEICGTTNSLIHNPNNRYTTNCKACFGDTKCGIDKNNYIIKNIKVINATVNCVTIDLSQAIFPQNLPDTTIKNINKLIEQSEIILPKVDKYAAVTRYSGGQLLIANNVNHSSLLSGDIINLQIKCDQSFRQCKNFFRNQLQFRGEILLSK
jgi:hypothetical protein